MNRRGYVLVVGNFLVFSLLQVTVLRHLILFDYAYCFIYVLPLLLLPLEIGPLPLMAIGFAQGLVMDSFYDMAGIHAAGSVFIMYLRPRVIRMLTPGGGYDPGVRPSPDDLGWGWFLSYAAPLMFLHHLFLFFLEAGQWALFWSSLTKAIFSTVFTLTVSSLVLYFRMPQKRRRL